MQSVEIKQLNHLVEDFLAGELFSPEGF